MWDNAILEVDYFTHLKIKNGIMIDEWRMGKKYPINSKEEEDKEEGDES